MAGRYQSYPEYRHSGVEWLGKVPNEWIVCRLAYVFTDANAGEVIDKSYWGDGEEVLYTCNRTPLRSDFDKFPDRKRTRKSDLLLTRNGTPYVHKPLVGSIYSNVVQRITLSDEFDRDFLSYCLGNSARNLKGYGVSIESLNFENWKSLFFAYPKKAEQKKVVSFLDHETAKIDTLIEKQQLLIELLEEKCQAVISHAVTKGLNPDAPMRYSGVEWLGEVPAHWDVTKLGYLTNKIGSGKTPKGGAEVYVDEGVLFLRSQNVYDDGLRVQHGECVFIDESVHAEMHGTKVVSGDVLLNITGGSIGRSSLVPENFREANVNQHVCIIRLPEGQRAFISWFMKSRPVKEQIDSCQVGGNREGLNFEQVADLKISLPPKRERDEIASFLLNSVERMGVLLESAHDVIDLLQERRSALISSAVTGKIDVRDWQPPESNAGEAA